MPADFGVLIVSYLLAFQWPKQITWPTSMSRGGEYNGLLAEERQSYMVLTLKIKQPVFLPAKWGYLGLAVELQFGTCKLWQTISKSGEQRRGIRLYRGKGETGRGCFRHESIGRGREDGFSLAGSMAPHWLGFLLDKEKISLLKPS